MQSNTVSASNTKSITRNIISLSVGQVLSLIISFLSITLAARYIGVSDFGNFSFLLAVMGIISKIVDLGFVPIVTRETTKESRNFSYINNAITIRSISFIVIFLVFNSLMIFGVFSKTDILLADILFINIFISTKFQNIRELLDVPFKIDLKMHYSMIITVLDNVLFLIFVLLMPVIKSGIFYLVITYVISNIPGFLFIVYFLKKKYGYKYKPELERTKWLVIESLPLGGFVLLTALFQQIDVLFLKTFDSAYATGIFAAALRLALPLNIIPFALSTTVFPLIVSNIRDNNEKNEKIVRLVYKVLFFIAFVLAVVSTFKAEKLVVLVFGKQYIDATIPTILLLWSQIFLFHNFFTIDLFTAYNKQKYSFIYSIFVIVINVVFILLLISKYSFVGLSLAKLIACFFGYVLVLALTKKIKISADFMNGRIIGWLITVSFALYILSKLPLFVYLCLSVVLIILLTKFLGFFNNEEILLFLRMINKEKWAAKLIKT